MIKNTKKIRIFSALEIANICGVVNQTAINWIKKNHLKAFTTPGGQYRVYEEDLLDFLKARKMKLPAELIKATKKETKKSILIVDDHRELNNLIKDIFVKKIPEYELFQAFDGYEAGKCISSNKPDIIILDIDLPGVKGHKICREIREDAVLNNPVIIAISGLDNKEEGELILNEGADIFFPKPIDFNNLINSLKSLEKSRICNEK